MKCNSNRWGLLPFFAENKAVVSFYGGGGKTSLMYSLAAEIIQKLESSVLITTTTKIMPPKDHSLVLADSFAEAKAKVLECFKRGKGVVLGRYLLPESGKVEGIPTQWIDDFYSSSIADAILVEADGAARKPAKGFAPYEPVIPACTTALAPVLGMDCLDKPLTDEYFHRLKELSDIVGKRAGQTFDILALKELLNYMIYLGRNDAPQALVVPCLNKFDLVKEPVVVFKELSSLTGASFLLFTSTCREPLVQSAFFLDQDKVLRPWLSAVILAAGMSTRMGRPKLLQELGGKKVLSYVLEAALSSRVDEVIVVLPPGQEELLRLVQSYPVSLVVNNRFKEGQSTSMKAGLKAISSYAQAALFLLGDQPLIKSSAIDQLISSYLKSFDALHYPVYRGKRGNPVLFDRRMFIELTRMQGDEGGRSLLQKYKNLCRPVPTECSGVIMDIDTPADLDAMRRSLPVMNKMEI